MGDLSKHFSKREFACKCGKVHEFTMDSELIDKLEKLHALTNARAIYITSGYRCPAHSKSVGGYMNDAHTKGIAADITITLQDGKTLSGDKIAEGAERVGFSGIGIITDAVTATGSAAADAGMSYEQLAAVSAKVAERTREDGSSIGNAIKTILTRISKVGKMPGYADEVDNETLSKASESLNEIGIAVTNSNSEKS